MKLLRFSPLLVLLVLLVIGMNVIQGGVDKVKDLATQGSLPHQKKLYLFYMAEGEQHDEVEAFKWVKMAAEKGDPGAQFTTAQFYLQGLASVDIDKTKALTLFEKSAKQGNKDAQRLTGIMYLKGEGAVADYAMSRHWLEKAALQGDERAKSILPTVDRLSALSKQLGKQ